MWGLGPQYATVRTSSGLSGLGLWSNPAGGGTASIHGKVSHILKLPKQGSPFLSNKRTSDTFTMYGKVSAEKETSLAIIYLSCAVVSNHDYGSIKVVASGCHRNLNIPSGAASDGWRHTKGGDGVNRELIPFVLLLPVHAAYSSNSGRTCRYFCALQNSCTPCGIIDTKQPPNIGEVVCAMSAMGTR